MKFFKKARELFDRLRGDDTPPPPAAPATVEYAGDSAVAKSEKVLDPRYRYRRDQADFRERAKVTTPVYDLGGTFDAGRNVAKRTVRAAQRELRGRDGGWKKLWGCKMRALRATKVAA